MIGEEDDLRRVSPRAVLSEIANAIPEDCRANIIVVGSLAAGYYFFRGNDKLVVRTKDADCMLSPRIEAISKGRQIAERLFSAGWQIREDERWSEPGTASTPTRDLPALRLHPPGNTDWFIELLAVPESPAKEGTTRSRLETTRGHFGLPSFRFLALANHTPIELDIGIRIGRPSLMALANLLEHPEIGTADMSGKIGGRVIKRSNKDLGRVLAISWLTLGEDENALETMATEWKETLSSCFPEDWGDLASHVGAGLRSLLESPNDLEEAHHTCVYGLLASRPPTVEMLRATGLRLLSDVVLPLEALGGPRKAEN